MTRFVGLLLAIYGIYTLGYEAVGIIISSLPHHVTPTMGAIFGTIYFVVGLGLLLGGGLITRLAYRASEP